LIEAAKEHDKAERRNKLKELLRSESVKDTSEKKHVSGKRLSFVSKATQPPMRSNSSTKSNSSRGATVTNTTTKR
jgi:hypothetical protein